MIEILAALFGISLSFIFLGAFIIGAVEIVGKLYGTFRCLVREDLKSEQRIIYLGIIWFVPLGWLIYFILGTEKTRELFSDVEFL
ncbi:MAG: hypothetical protein ABEJ83_03545 [Candidatus Nanohaloarchaea archaeon]